MLRLCYKPRFAAEFAGKTRALVGFLKLLTNSKEDILFCQASTFTTGGACNPVLFLFLYGFLNTEIYRNGETCGYGLSVFLPRLPFGHQLQHSLGFL